jgi:hypothetical protein
VVIVVNLNYAAALTALVLVGTSFTKFNPASGLLPGFEELLGNNFAVHKLDVDGDAFCLAWMAF